MSCNLSETLSVIECFTVGLTVSQTSCESLDYSGVQVIIKANILLWTSCQTCFDNDELTSKHVNG
jgi:hypothetical protein